jgi:hypothetical protein
MTTTLTQVGYGDFVPVSVYEMILLTFTMIVGGGMFSYIVGNAEQLFLDFQGIDVEAQNKIEEITRLVFEVSDIDAFIDNARFLFLRLLKLFFFFQAKIPKALRAKVIKYFQWHLPSPMRKLAELIVGLPEDLCAVLKMRIFCKAVCSITYFLPAIRECGYLLTACRACTALH